MIRPHRLLHFSIVVGLCTASYGDEPAKAASEKDLALARQVGWQAALNVVEHLREAKQPGFPGIEAWLNDFGKQTKGLDPTDSPEKWPTIDADALTTHNPDFWRAFYEFAPGDPGVAFLYSGVLLGCGELTRAKRIMEFQNYRPGMPPQVRKAFADLYNAAKKGGMASEGLVETGIKLFDKGDYPGAIKEYQSALTFWPQNGWAHYELAYTLRIQELIAAGVKPTLPTEGIVTRINTDQDKRVKYSTEVKTAYAQSREHDPLMFEAYQGDDHEVIRGALALTGKAIPAITYMRQKPNAIDIDAAIEKLAEGCQEAEIHDFALVARQMLVARRGNFDWSDHPFITKSLRALAPGRVTEDTLERLAGGRTAFYRLIPTADQDRPAASETMFHLGRVWYIKEKNSDDQFTIVVTVEAQKAESFEKPGLKLAYVAFDRDVTTPPTDLKSTEDLSRMTKNKDGTMDLMRKLRSAKLGLTGEAHAYFARPNCKSVGKNGVMAIGFHGLPDKVIGLFVWDEKLEPGSNVLIFRKSDFTVGDGDAVFQAAVAKIPASD